MVAITKKIGAKPSVKTEVVEKARQTMITVGNSETVSAKIKIGAEYGVWSIELLHSKSVESGADVESTLDELIEKLDAKCMAYAETKVESLRGTAISSISQGNEIEETEEAGEEEITEPMVRMMSKKDLVKFIEEYGIDVVASEHKTLGKLRDAVAETVFGASDEVGQEAGEEEAGEEEGITEESVREMDREELTNLISEYGLEIEVKGKKLKEIIEEVLEAISAGGEEEEVGEEEEGTLTEEMIKEMDREELGTVITEYGLEVDPKGYKKLADLINAVTEALFVEDTDTSEFENVDFSEEN